MVILGLSDGTGKGTGQCPVPMENELLAQVDFFSGLVYNMLGLPASLYTPLFATARIVGWCAHRLEELQNVNRIIRPAYMPLCPHKEYIPIDER